MHIQIHFNQISMNVSMQVNMYVRTYVYTYMFFVDVVEVLCLLQSLLEPSCLVLGPSLQLIGTKNRSSWNQLCHGIGHIVLVLVQSIHGVEQGDVPGSSGRTKTKADLRLPGTIQQGSCKCAHGPARTKTMLYVCTYVCTCVFLCARECRGRVT